MTKTFKRIIAAGIVFIALAAGACALALSGGCSANAGNPIEDAKNGAINAALDASGIKGQLDSELRNRAGEIAEQIGISKSVVDKVVDTLDIEDWHVTALPPEATETGTYFVEAAGNTANITTYDDPSIVTIGAYGQTLTMEVPEQAQGYLPYLQYLQYLQ